MNEVSDAIVISERQHKTRAQVQRDKVKIRLATDEAGLLIADVLKSNGIELPFANWSKVFPSWLIATVDDDVIGCVQVMPAKPVGYAEWLYVKPSAPFKMRAIAVHKLIYAAIATVQQAGASYITCLQDNNNTKFSDVLKKINFVPVSENTRLVKRLAGD